MLMHEDNSLRDLFNRHIHEWKTKEITLWLTFDLKGLPRFVEKVYEFVPREYEPKTTPRTKHSHSPPLVMVHMDSSLERKERIYDRYISDIVEHHMDVFSQLSWKGDHSGFQERLFLLITRLKSKRDDEACYPLHLLATVLMTLRPSLLKKSYV
jgi:hypothetical protein